ncbi:PAS domain S-box-containing protein [Desulfocicer vacuolatum DSM 3385]|uniref:histidine kinase n=1 Tax=Desulfocicer vacuolatum DSM 3385 TaxID=1121400 RepID=A0A1W2CK16_9BACT|nr:ATP-binding protein [Desulfocicer vacuolatum]SMC85531.1 PAS domain S-box-containing protein [Desulfocicer vacuolatum DSM 3385]
MALDKANRFPWNLTMATRLFLFVFAAILLVICPLSYMGIRSLENFGSYATSVNETQIWELSSSYLSRIVFEQAQKADAMFQRITAVSSLMGERAMGIYDRLEQHSIEKWSENSLVFNPGQNIFYSSPSKKVVTLYWGDKKITPGIDMEIRALSHLESLLERSKSLVPESFATHLISESGVGMYCASTSQGIKQLFELPDPSMFDLRDGEPFTIFSNDPSGVSKTRWTRLYKDDVNNDMSITASTSLYDASGVFKGIVGIDVSLGHLLREVFNSENHGDGRSKILFSFLLNKQGRLIMFPREYFDLFGLEVDLDKFMDSSDTLDYGLQDSTLEQVRAVADKICHRGEQIMDLNVKQEDYILVTSPLDSLGWHLVLVTREDDLKSSIQKTRNQLDSTMVSLEYQFLVINVVVICFALLFMFWMIRLFVLPVKKLTQSIGRVTHGDFSIRVPVQRKDELGQLAMAFNEMVERLEASNQLETKLVKRVLKVTDTLNSIFDSSTEYAIIATDLQFRVLHYNPASKMMFGSGINMGMDLDVRQLHGEQKDSGATFDKGLEQVEKTGSYQFEWVYKDDAKKRHVVSSTLMPMKNQEQTLVGYLLFSRDISAFQELQARLLRSDRLAVTGQLAASVAHQINSPLQGISAFIDLMKENAASDEEMMECLAALTQGFESIRTTVENLMDLTRPGKEKKQHIDINKVIQDTLALVRLHIQQAGVELSLNFSPALPLIHASSSQISHVILNLVNNALEAMDGQTEAKQIWVTSVLMDETIEIQFQDTGPGIAKEHMDYVFDPFYTTKNVLGMGMGLSVCNGFIENHGGTIRVESSGSQGACFTIVLPMG